MYQAAGIPAPAYRSPRPAPGTPMGFKVELRQNGDITLSFKCPHHPRTGEAIYRVERRLTLPRAVKHWSLTTLREKLIKIGAKVVRHAR